MNAHFHPLLFCDCKELDHGDKQLVAQIFQSDAIKPLQRRRANQDDVIKLTSNGEKQQKTW